MCWQPLPASAAMPESNRHNYEIVTLTGGTGRAERDGRGSIEEENSACIPQ